MQQTPVSPQELFASLSGSIFVIEVMDEAGTVVAQGSGVAISENQVVTNFHVVRDGDDLRVKQGQGTWRAEVMQIDPAHDLCILSVPGLQGDAVSLRDSSTLAVGEPVYALGAPAGLELTFTDGIISGIRTEAQGRVIQTNAAISPGSSGGGLFDNQGQLVGITSFYLRGTQSLNFAVPAERIKSLQAQTKEATSDAWVSVGDERVNAAKNLQLATMEAVLRETHPPGETLEAWAQRMLKKTPTELREWRGALRAYGWAWMGPRRVPGRASSAQLWLKIGTVHAELGDRGRMEFFYNLELRDNPNDSSVFEDMAHGYIQVRAFDEALKAYREAVRLKPNDPRLRDKLDGFIKALQERERLKTR